MNTALGEHTARILSQHRIVTQTSVTSAMSLAETASKPSVWTITICSLSHTDSIDSDRTPRLTTPTLRTSSCSLLYMAT